MSIFKGKPKSIVTIHKNFLDVRIRSCSIFQWYYLLSKMRTLTCSACAFFLRKSRICEKIFDFPSFVFPQPLTMEWYSHSLRLCPSFLCFLLRFFFHPLFLAPFILFSLLFNCLLASSRHSWLLWSFQDWKFKSRMWRDFRDSEIKHVDFTWSAKSCLKYIKEVTCTLGQ